MKLGEVVVIHVYYNFTKFHQNWMKNKKVLLSNSLFFCSVFQSVSRIVKIIHSELAQLMLTDSFGQLGFIKKIGTTQI